MDAYPVAVAVFCAGVATIAITVAYIVGQYNKFKNKDPFEGE